MKNIYQENLEEIERQNELIKKYDWEKTVNETYC